MPIYNKPPYYISAYSLAVKAGFKGTIEEWIASLAGGYYTPSALDNGDGTITLSFDASKADMPVVVPQRITLPQGPVGPVAQPVYIILYYSNTDGSYSTSAQAADILAAYRSGRELCCVVPVNGQQVMLPLLSVQEDGTRLVCTFGGTGAWLTGDEVCTVSAWLEVSGGMVVVKVQEASAGHASAIGRVSREYETNDYLVALTYHTQGSDVQSKAKMLMYLSANGVDFRKVAAMPIDFDKKIYDLSTIYVNDMWVIAFDCIDYEYNEWTQENSKYNRGGNRVGIITTTDFIEFKQVYVELPLEWKSTWAPELFVVDGKLHMIITTSTCTVTRDTASGGKTYVKDGIYICRLNDDFTLESYQQITLPDDGIAPDNYIDGFIYQADGVFYLGIKEETNKKQRIYKSDDLYGDYTLVHEFEEQVEGLSIVKFNDRHFAYSDKYVSGGFYQGKGTAISVSSDLQTWSGHAMANVDGDAWNRHFTPFVVSTPEQKQSIDSLLKSFGPVDAPLDTWSKKSYCVAAGTGKYTIERLLIQPNAVYYISGGADLTIDFVDTSLMSHGDTCKFIISSMASNAKITFKYNEGNTLFWDNLEDLVYSKSNGVLTVTCGNGVANKYCFAEVSASSGTDYTLPVATPNRLGGVKPVEATDEMTQPVGVTLDGKLMTAPGGSAGSGGEWKLVKSVTLEQDVGVVIIGSDDGTVSDFKECFAEIVNPKSTANSVGYVTIVGTSATPPRLSSFGAVALEDGEQKSLWHLYTIGDEVFIETAPPSHTLANAGSWSQWLTSYKLGRIKQLKIQADGRDLFMAGATIKLYVKE